SGRRRHARSDRDWSSDVCSSDLGLERAGQYDRAASLYFATLRADPTNLAALLGLERVLPPLNRLEELLPVARRAAAAGPQRAALRGVLLRTYVALSETDSARSVALAWAADAPRDEAPYRDWAIALEDYHHHDAAGEVLLGWGQPQRAWDVFAPSVATPSADAAYALRRFADLAAASNTPAARRVGALALARFAEMVPEPLAVRARADAARAFLEA